MDAGGWIESWVVSTGGRALAYGTPLLWATLGEIGAERAGVVNLGVEGMMILGALTGFAVTQTSGSPWLGLAAAAAVGGAASLLHGVLAIGARANQYVSGLALTLFGLGLTGILGRGWEGVPLRHPLGSLDVPALQAIPVVGPILFRGQDAVTYLGLILAVVFWFLLFQTRWGIVVRSTGESPETADVLGTDVSRVRCLAVLAGGVMAGVAGGYLSVVYRPSWTEGMTAGMGWIAVALAIFARWHPLRAVGGALLFGALYSLSFRLQSRIAPELLKMMPYAFTILVLAVGALGRNRWQQAAPEALAQPYERGER